MGSLIPMAGVTGSSTVDSLLAGPYFVGSWAACTLLVSGDVSDGAATLFTVGSKLDNSLIVNATAESVGAVCLGFASPWEPDSLPGKPVLSCVILARRWWASMRGKLPEQGRQVG